MPELSDLTDAVCQYCTHRNTGAQSRCGHCGAPLRARVRRVETAVEHGVTDAVKSAERVVEGASKLESLVTKRHPRVQWLLVAGALGVMVVLAVVAVRSCSTMFVAPDGFGANTVTLPAPLRSAATCQPAPEATGSERCVIAADHSILAGGIAGGRAMSFYAEKPTAERLADAVRKWRAAGGTVLVDGEVFIAIGPSETVRYVDTRTGLRLETGAFTGRAAVRTFLDRSGLAQ
ncbi:hypothetical protein [Nocardia callitridis]|uniref:Uncharacterized protein n=1 Tax=Nocardia callitridis TaxID=648753 RepID=A0ABP9KMU5_9NOCA